MALDLRLYARDSVLSTNYLFVLVPTSIFPPTEVCTAHLPGCRDVICLLLPLQPALFLCSESYWVLVFDIVVRGLVDYLVGQSS